MRKCFVPRSKTTKLLLLDSLLQESRGVRLQDDQGNQLLWKAAQQDALHLQEMRKCFVPHPKKTCAACGFPAAKIRGYNWSIKAKRRKTTGTGRMRSLSIVRRKFRNGFREMTQAQSQKKQA